MIRSFRQRHRRMVIALGVILPVAFAVGIAVRKPVPIVAELPAGLVATPQKFNAIKWKRADLFSKSPIQVRLLREQKQAGEFAIAFSATKDFVRPDLIVYWVVGSSQITEKLPDDAVLLGSFSATSLPLSDEAAKSSGSLVLYSLADNEIVDVSKPVQFNDSTR